MYPSDRESERDLVMSYIEKIFFPNQQPWQRKRNLKTFLIVIAVTITFAAIFGAVMYLRNSRQF